MQGLLHYVASRTIDSDLGWINLKPGPTDIVSGGEGQNKFGRGECVHKGGKDIVVTLGSMIRDPIWVPLDNYYKTDMSNCIKKVL